MNQVIARQATVLPAERVSECERLGELFRANQKASAIDIPIFRHKTSTPNFMPSASTALRAANFSPKENEDQPAGIPVQGDANVRAELRLVNSQMLLEPKNVVEESAIVKETHLRQKCRSGSGVLVGEHGAVAQISVR